MFVIRVLYGRHPPGVVRRFYVAQPKGTLPIDVVLVLVVVDVLGVRWSAYIAGDASGATVDLDGRRSPYGTSSGRISSVSLGIILYPVTPLRQWIDFTGI